MAGQNGFRRQIQILKRNDIAVPKVLLVFAGQNTTMCDTVLRLQFSNVLA